MKKIKKVQTTIEVKTSEPFDENAVTDVSQELYDMFESVTGFESYLDDICDTEDNAGEPVESWIYLVIDGKINTKDKRTVRQQLESIFGRYGVEIRVKYL